MMNVDPMNVGPNKNVDAIKTVGVENYPKNPRTVKKYFKKLISFFNFYVHPCFLAETSV